jgi:hypothetical protein
MNKWLLVTVITLGAVPSGALRAGTPQGTPQAPAPDTDALNVNSRYTVEKVDLKRVPWEKGRVSLPLQHEIDKIVGQNLDQEALETIAKRLQKELRVPKVNVRVAKGHMPDRVVVTFEAGQKERDLDLDIDRFLYHSKQGWTGEGGASIVLHGNRFSFGLVSDADRLAERYAGIQAGYERYSLGTDRVGLRFRFGSYHQQWNQTTLDNAAPGDLYRTRQNFVPEVVVRLSEPLEWTAGVDFARYETFIPNPVALGPVARTEASNAAVTTLRYRQRWGSNVDDYVQTLTASYGVRAGTGIFGSDAIFTRQFMDAAYSMKHGRQTVKVSFLGGRTVGAPPMFERFVLGNATTLRGWNKFDLNPAGATRAVHGSVEYIYRHLLFFYDTGSAWNAGEDPEQRQSVGVGLNGGGFEFGVGFPIKNGRANPVVYVGMKF